jgi:hypothetical protein
MNVPNFLQRELTPGLRQWFADRRQLWIACLKIGLTLFALFHLVVCWQVTTTSRLSPEPFPLYLSNPWLRFALAFLSSTSAILCLLILWIRQPLKYQLDLAIQLLLSSSSFVGSLVVTKWSFSDPDARITIFGTQLGLALFITALVIWMLIQGPDCLSSDPENQVESP